MLRSLVGSEMCIRDRLKAAGYVPLTFGNTDGWPAGQTFGEILNTMLPDLSLIHI